MFTTGKRNDGESYVFLTDNATQELKDSVKAAHGDRLPNDFTFGTYADLMQKITDYNLDTIDELEDVRGEIVDSHIDIYTADLTKWLASDINNVDYISQALDEGDNIGTDGFRLLSVAQYLAIDEVMNEVVNLLSK